MSTTRITWAIFLIAVVTAVVVGLCTVDAAAAAGPELQGTLPTQDCAACHSDLAQQWQSSKHATAFSDDAFKKTWAEAAIKNTVSPATRPATMQHRHLCAEGVACQACTSRLERTAIRRRDDGYRFSRVLRHMPHYHSPRVAKRRARQSEHRLQVVP